MGESFKNLWCDSKDDVPANTLKAVDTIALSSFRVAEYLVLFIGGSPEKTKSLKLNLRKTDSNIETQVYARSGDLLAVGIDAVINGANAELQVNNSEAFAIEVKFARLNL